MDTKRAQTLEALETFIQTQRSLLARTQSDITQLQKLRSDAIARRTDFAANLSDELNNSAFRLSDRCDILTVPQNIDWTLFEGHDPKALQNLATDSRQEYAQRNQPFLYQRSELSDLQKLVKDARRTIIDPVLAVFESISEPEDEEEEVDVEEVRREQEREKLRQLKKRKIRSWGGLKLPSSHGQIPAGVFIRHDVDDESPEVDITFDNDLPNGREIFKSISMDPTASPTSHTSQPESSSTRIPKSPRSRRTRQPSTKLRSGSSKAEPSNTAAKLKSKPSHPVENDAEHDVPSDPSTSTHKPRGPGKPKSETYKQAWSMSEQHLLEQLLEQIPDGEKNRWQKISRAMDGKRTPRQVASRVQKYFEKLKRFGVGLHIGQG